MMAMVALARLINEVRRALRFRAGKHRSVGLSTYEWVRMQQVFREC